MLLPVEKHHITVFEMPQNDPLIYKKNGEIYRKSVIEICFISAFLFCNYHNPFKMRALVRVPTLRLGTKVTLANK